LKNDDEFLEAVNDYMEMSAKYKLAIVFTNASQGDYTFNGKYFIDEDMYEKMLVKSNNSMEMTLRANGEGGYALSVSKGNKGLKFVMRIKVGLKGTFNSSDFEGEDEYPDIYKNATINLTINVYDNNSSVPQYTKTITNFEDAIEYLSGMGNSFFD
jgi:hypothetical protein